MKEQVYKKYRTILYDCETYDGHWMVVEFGIYIKPTDQAAADIGMDCPAFVVEKEEFGKIWGAFDSVQAAEAETESIMGDRFVSVERLA